MEKKDNAKIAVVDDSKDVNRLVASYIRKAGYKADTYTEPGKFLDDFANHKYDLLLTDLVMPEIDGINLLKEVKAQAPETLVVMMSGHAEKNDAIAALKHGAFDFFEKPVKRTELIAVIERTIGYQKAIHERDELAEKLSLVAEKEANRWGIKAFVGQSAKMKKVVKKIRTLQSKRSTNVLILGESGTGKELVARAIHYDHENVGKPFVAVNCSAIPVNLSESILFGHIKGAFTGATADQKGKFELANGGTLFLDEIGDMPPMLQTKLLRVLEDGMIYPVGSTKGKKVDVRVISATNTDLNGKVESGDFRLDLYHRLSGYVIDLPPLRDRPADLHPLVHFFVSQLSEEMGIPEPEIDQSFIDQLKAYAFPGNIRELKNTIERSLIDATEGHLTGDILEPPAHSRKEKSYSQPQTPASQDNHNVPFDLQEAEAILVKRAVDHANGNVAEAARLLNISRAKIYRILK